MVGVVLFGLIICYQSVLKLFWIYVGLGAYR